MLSSITGTRRNRHEKDLIICVSSKLKGSFKANKQHAVYHSSTEEVSAKFATKYDEATHPLFVGHNPHFPDLHSCIRALAEGILAMPRYGPPWSGVS